MKKVHLVSQVDESRCIGDRVCENVCPAGAIVMMEKKARVDESRCVACFKCQDVCSEDAIRFVARSEARLLRVDPSEVDAGRLEALCRRANLDPEEPICLCTLTQAKEVAAAILKGAATPEEVTRMTGIRTSCAMWCMAPVLRLLRAHGLELSPPKGYRWYDIRPALWEVPDEVVRRYPEYRIEEDREALLHGGMDNLISKLK
ncbi:MAG: 4Fe-4S binding protein [Proteobacteria bacterium]|nr:4Fe-4S binding protein [Pseudomonadota bacterium]